MLGLSVWIIYLTDHILDSILSQEEHKYLIFKNNLLILFSALLVFISVDVFLIIKYVPAQLLKNGLIPGILLVLYLSAQHFLKGHMRKYFPKELIISIIYVYAIWLYPWFYADSTELSQFFLISIHFLLVFSNVLMFSFFERSDDRRNYQLTVFNIFPAKWLKTLILIILVAAILLLFLSLTAFSQRMFFYVLLTVLVIYFLEMIYSDTPFVRRNNPAISDGAFLLFLVFLF